MQTDSLMSTQHQADHSLVTLGGEFDVASRDRLRDALRQAVDGCPGDRVVVDLTAVEFMDCTVLGVLVHAHNHAAALGRQLVLVNPAGPVQRLLSISQIDRMIPSQPDLRAAAHSPVVPIEDDFGSRSA